MRKWTIGIYAIRNKKNGKYYVGSAAECEKRWVVHRHHLRRGTHHSIKLQRSWNRHGEDSFKFRILERCELGQLAEQEQYWMDYYGAFEQGYNCHPRARTARGYKVTGAALENLRNGAIRRAACPEERKLRSERAKAQHAAGVLGRKTWKKGTSERLRQLTKQRMNKPEARAAISKIASEYWNKKENRERKRAQMQAFARANPEEMSRRSMMRKDRRTQNA